MFEEIKQKFNEQLENAKNMGALEDLRVQYLGRNGELNNIFKEFKNLSELERAGKGKQINELKKELEESLKKISESFGVKKDVGKEWLDVTAPGTNLPYGHLHPRTLVLREMQDIFQSLGFSVVDGPEVETEWYNFEALNLPENHPSRDMQDTFYLKNGMIPRTHTSPVQVRFMESHNPPLRIIVPGRVFRREATDASHDYQFYQVEGLMVDKEISVANFKAVIEEFFKRLFKQKISVRLRPSYFPFTEPSFEMDFGCVFCNQKGCKVCSQSGWLEIGGAGMVNQFVFESAGYMRNKFQGFAFGIGFERILMMKYGINDIRLLSSGDLRFLRQF